MDKIAFPAAFQRGQKNALHDINSGGGAVRRRLQELLDKAFTAVAHSQARQAKKEIQNIFRSDDKEISRIEKTIVPAAQEQVDELDGYLALLCGFATSARAAGVSVRIPKSPPK